MAAPMEKTRHPGIYKRGSRYVVVWRHKGRQHKSFHPTLAEAREAKGQRQGGDRRPVTRQSFEDYVHEWLDGYRGRTSRGLSNRTRNGYRSALVDRAVPFFRSYKLAEVEPPDVRRFIAQLEAEGLAPSSIRKEVAPLRAMFATAFEDGAIRSNPTAGVRINGRRGDEEEEHAKALTSEELGRLLAELPQEWRLFFEFLAHTGLRVSEAIGLTWEDVEFGENPRLRLRRQYCRGEWQRLKSRYSRRDVPLSTGMARKLWVSRRGQRDADPVFATRNRKLIREENLRRRVLQPAAKRAGVPWVGFHALRHTCASLLFARGKNPKQVQEWLGHHKASFTLDTYIHLIDGRQERPDFLDDAVKVGNAWATEDPQTAATEGVPEATDSAF